MGGILGLLVLGPIALALAVLLLPAPWWRRAVVGGALVLTLVALIACRAAGRDGPDLRGAWAAEGGLLDRALARAGVQGLEERGALREALVEVGPGGAAGEAGGEALERAAGLFEARAALRDVQRLHADDPAKLDEARSRLRQAEARLAGLVARRQALVEEMRTLRQAVAAPRGAELRLAAYAPWAPGLGLSWLLAVDALGGALLLAIALVGLAAAAGLPPGEEGRVGAATSLALQGALGGVIVSQDAALLWGFVLLLQLPAWLLLLGDDGPGRAKLAERWSLLALGSALPLGAALAAAAHAAAAANGGGGGAVFALPTLWGAVPAGVQGGLVAAALLLALPRLLPLPGAWSLGAQLERAPGPTRGLVQLAWVGVGVWVLLALVPSLAPAALAGAEGQLGAARLALAGLGLAALLGGGARALLVAPGAATVAALVQARGGLAALGVAAGGEAGLLGAALALISLAASGGAAQLAAAGLERGGGDLAQRLSRRPLLARIAALTLLFLAGLPGSSGFLAGLLILEAAHASLNLVVVVLAAGGLLLLAWAALRAVGRAVGELRAGAPARAVQDLTAVEAQGILPLVVLELTAGLFPRLFLDPLLPACARLAGELRS